MNIYKNGLLVCCLILFSGFCTFAQSSQVTFSDPLITLMGRTHVQSDGSVLLGYPGVTFATKVTGNQLSINAHSTSDKTYIEVLVDDQDPQIFKLDTKPRDYQITLNHGKKHNVRIINRAESWHGLVTFNYLVTDGKFFKGPKLPSRKLLVLGDSVTCASSIDRKPNVKPDTDASNPRESYGMKIAKTLKSQVQLICMGGHGLVRTWDGLTDQLNLADYYELTYPSLGNKVIWNHKNYQADLILITIGTNDFSQGIPDEKQYVTAYQSLLEKLLKDHPKAKIVISEGAILNGEKKLALTNYLGQIIKRTSDKRVRYLESGYYPGEPIDAHPTKAEHQKMAEDFIPKLKKLMNW